MRYFRKGHKAKIRMLTKSSQTEKEYALRTASLNGEVLHVRRLLDERTNPNCADWVIKIE
jgi:hypothetical protein